MAKKGKSVKPANQGNQNKYEEIENLLQIMTEHGVRELEWEKKGERIYLSKNSTAQTYLAPEMAPAPRAHAPASPAAAAPAPASAAHSAPTNHKQILSPFVGTFYRAASPGAPEYVKEGQSIKKGDVLCIVEAMKLMNEIEAEFDGKIVSILVENGQPVEFGEPLFIAET